MSEQQKIYDLESRVMGLQDTIDELECDRDLYKPYCKEKDEEVKSLQEEIDEKEEIIKEKDKIIRDMKVMALKMVRFK